MRTSCIFLVLAFVQYVGYSQCQNTNQNPLEAIITPQFSDYEMVVANNITAGDYFSLGYTESYKTIKIDLLGGTPVYVHFYLYDATFDTYYLIDDGPTPLTVSLDVYENYQVHINTISPLCGEDNMNRAITLECMSCPVHEGVGINVPVVDKSAALEINGSQGGLLLPKIPFVNQVTQPKEGLLHFNEVEDELEFYDGSDWKRTFSLAENDSKFDFKRSETDNTGVDGALFSVYNTSNYFNSMSGLRLFNGNQESSPSAAMFYRNNKLHFAHKGGSGSNVISIDNSYLEMDENAMKFTGTTNLGVEIKKYAINTDGALRVNDESLRDIYLAPNGGRVSVGNSGYVSSFIFNVFGKSWIDELFVDERAAIGGSNVIDPSTSLRISGEDNNGTNSTLKLQSGTQTMLFDGNEMDSYSTSALYLQNNSDDDIVLVNGGGKVGIAETSPSAMLHIKQVGSTEEGLLIENDNNSNNWGFEIGNSLLYFSYNGTNKAYISSSDGSWNQASDRRLKKDVKYDNRSILPSVLALKPASYRYIDNKQDTPNSYGFIAQEVQELFPELVKNEEGKFLSISYSEFSVLAIKAIQEQQLIIQDLEDKYEALEARLARLEKR